MEDIVPSFPGWEVVELLGRGGMCAVYRARRVGTGEERALKVLAEDTQVARARFLDEARILAELDHPHLVTVEEVVDGDPPWMVMELLRGEDLGAPLQRGEPVEPRRAAAWIAAVAQGLQVAHDRGIVHRDIKPSNIMIGDDGLPRLIDFGVARRREDARRTREGVVMGTAAYLPPEVYLGGGRALQDDPVADVYALGQTLCEMLIGRPIHRLDGRRSTMLARILGEKMSRPYLDPEAWRPGLPEDLRAVVRDATAQEPTDRIRSAGELEARLRRFLEMDRGGDGAGVEMEAPAPMEERAADAERAGCGSAPVVRYAMGVGLFWTSAAVLVLVLTAVALVGLWLFRPDPARRALRRALEAQALEASGVLRGCADTPVELVVRVRVRGGGVQVASIDGGTEAVRRCVAAELTAWRVDLPDAEVDLPLRLLPLPR